MIKSETEAALRFCAEERQKEEFFSFFANYKVMKENNVPVDKLVETAWVTWKRPCEEYFDMLVPDAYEAEWADLAHKKSNDVWEKRSIAYTTLSEFSI